MTEAGPRQDARPARDRAEPSAAGRPAPCYAALDLGTNNCRLLIASPAGPAGAGGFRVVESFSRIVRLGEGLSRTGRLDAAAMDRAAAALAVCAEKVRRRRVVKLRAVATQACRSAADGAEFVARIRRETGLELEVIDPGEEARLAVVGCRNLIDPAFAAALVLDVGGGSTELSWLDLRSPAPSGARPEADGWVSIPVGVVGLAERYPEPDATGPGATGPDARALHAALFRAMVEHVKAALAGARMPDSLAAAFAAGQGHLVGTSGAITSLAGMHLGLRRYDRSRVDGLWLSHDDCTACAERLMALGQAARAREPCIGPDRADLVLAGAAILEAVQEMWPCARVRVADRGLREGLLIEMMGARPSASRRRRNGSPRPALPA